MKIPKWEGPGSQISTLGRHEWSVSRLIDLSRDFPVFDAPIDCLDLTWKYEVKSREFVMHMKAVMDASLDYPIILDEDGEIMDGRHRVMKAMYLGLKSVKAVRFDENPPPCRMRDD